MQAGLRRNDGGDRIEKSGRKLGRALKNNLPLFPSVAVSGQMTEGCQLPKCLYRPLVIPAQAGIQWFIAYIPAKRE